MKRTVIFSSILTACLTAAISAMAQPSAPTAIQQQQNAQQNMTQQQMLTSVKSGTNAPEIYAGEESDTGPQHILQVVARRNLFEVRADSEYLYTDNALL